MKKLPIILLGLYTLLMPIFYWYGVDFREAQMRLWQSFAVVFALVAVMLPQKWIQFNKLNFAIAIFGVWAYILYALVGFKVGGQVFTNIFYGILLYWAMVRTIDKKDYHIVPKILLVVAVYNIVLILMQQYAFDPIYKSQDVNSELRDPIGSFCLKSSMGMFFASIWGFWLIALEKFNVKLRNIKISNVSTAIIRFILALLPLYPLVISRSSGAIVAGVVSVMFYAWYRSRKWFWVALIILPLSSGFFIWKYDAPMGMFSTRPDMWKTVIQHTSQNPLTGLGLDSFRSGPALYFMDKNTKKTAFFPRVMVNNNVVAYELPKDLGERYDAWDDPHNEYLHLYTDTGIVGLGIFGYIVYLFWRRLKSRPPSVMAIGATCCIVALLVSGLTQFPFHLARIGFLLPLMGAILFTETDYA